MTPYASLPETTKGERERDRGLALDDLQRQTLIDLQDALDAWVTTVGEVDFRHREAHEARQTRMMSASHPELVKRELAERLLVFKLVERVRNETTRDHGHKVLILGVEAMKGPTTYEESHARVELLRKEATQFSLALGSELRHYL